VPPYPPGAASQLTAAKAGCHHGPGLRMPAPRRSITITSRVDPIDGRADLRFHLFAIKGFARINYAMKSGIPSHRTTAPHA
jgi:hypothetical protein